MSSKDLLGIVKRREHLTHRERKGLQIGLGVVRRNERSRQEKKRYLKKATQDCYDGHNLPKSWSKARHSDWLQSHICQLNDQRGSGMTTRMEGGSGQDLPMELAEAGRMTRASRGSKPTGGQIVNGDHGSRITVKDRPTIINSPYRIAFIGPSGCGKTSWIIKLLQNRDVMLTKPPNKIYWFYSMNASLNDVRESLSELEIEFKKGLPSDAFLRFLENDVTEGVNNLVVIDDLVGEKETFDGDMNGDVVLRKIATKGSHHCNCDVLITMQYASSKANKFMTEIRNQATHLVIFQCNTSERSLTCIGVDVFGVGGGRWLNIALEHESTRDFPYVLINAPPNAPPSLKLRGGIFPDEENIFYVRKRNLPSEGILPRSSIVDSQPI